MDDAMKFIIWLGWIEIKSLLEINNIKDLKTLKIYIKEKE